MRYSLLLLAFLTGCNASPLQVMTVHDRAYLGVEIAGGLLGGSPPTPTPDNPTPAGDVCPECQGRGKLGDGTVCSTCWACGGTGKKKSDAPCKPTDEEPEADVSLWEDALQEYAAPIAPRSVVRMSGPRWTFENRGTNPPESFKAQHLASVHGIDTTGMTSAEMSAAHDNAHNHGDSYAYGPSDSGGTGVSVYSSSPVSSSCPSGNCPGTSSGRTTTGRRGLFGRWR